MCVSVWKVFSKTKGLQIYGPVVVSQIHKDWVTAHLVWTGSITSSTQKKTDQVNLRIWVGLKRPTTSKLVL